jgi:hypothetical protein
MYVNTKLIPVETVPGIGGGRMKERSGYLIHCKCYNVPPPRTTTIIKIF